MPSLTLTGLSFEGDGHLISRSRSDRVTGQTSRVEDGVVGQRVLREECPAEEPSEEGIKSRRGGGRRRVVTSVKGTSQTTLGQEPLGGGNVEVVGGGGAWRVEEGSSGRVSAWILKR